MSGFFLPGDPDDNEELAVERVLFPLWCARICNEVAEVGLVHSWMMKSGEDFMRPVVIWESQAPALSSTEGRIFYSQDRDRALELANEYL